MLVTGAGGFIGSHLVAALARGGDRVVALDVDLAAIRHLAGSDRIEFVAGDVADPEVQRRALGGVSTVFHLAAAHLGVSLPKREFERVNVEAVRSLTAAAAEAGVERFVHCSSVGVYGRLRHLPADEETPCRPELAYEATKLAGEKVVLEAARRDALPAVVLRPVWVYGPGCGRTAKLFRAAAKGWLLTAGTGENLRHCLYVRDMVAALLRAAEAEGAQPGEVLIVGDREAVTVRFLLEEVARVAGAPAPRSVPRWLVSLAALAAEAAFRPVGREPPLSRRSMRFFSASASFDTGKARRVLGFEPRFDLARGLEESYELLCARRPWRVRPEDYAQSSPRSPEGGHRAVSCQG